jgi:hypothetical protein
MKHYPFFSLENGHRPAFTRLIYALSYVLFEEINFRTLILIGNIGLALLLLLFFKILKVSHSKLFYFIPVPILLFQFQFWKNMTWVASALAHQYILLFTGLTFYFLSRKPNPGFYCAFFLCRFIGFFTWQWLGHYFSGLDYSIASEKLPRKDNLGWRDFAFDHILF